MMNKLLYSLIFIMALFASCTQSANTEQASDEEMPQAFENNRKVVFMILDGIPADVIENTETPNLDEIAGVGTYTRAVTGGEVGGESETPTISAVGYNSLITGTWANKHNVYGNGIKDPNYDYWNIFRIVENKDNNYQTAIFSTWLDNRTKLVGEGLPQAGNVKLDYSFDGFEHDTVNFPHAADRKFIWEIDEHVSKEAGRYIREKGPDVSWVYLEFTDDMGHGFGDSPQLTDAVKKADVQVGRVWEAVKERQEKMGEEWMILITTDHGRNAENGKGHGGQSERERTIWFFTNQEMINSDKLPEMVDGLPSMLEFMGVEAPEEIAAQFDGESFLKKN